MSEVDTPTAGQMAIAAQGIASNAIPVAASAIRFEVAYPAIDLRMADQVIEAFRAGLTERDIGKIAGLPAKGVVRYWRSISPEFEAACADAAEENADGIVAGMMGIADDVSRDPACRKVSLEHRRWLAGVLSKKYRKGGELQVESSLTVNQQINIAGDVALTPSDAYLRMIGK